MNGRAYVCGGCDRKGAVRWEDTGYECPVCHFRWEFPDMRRTAISRTLHREMPAPRKPAEVRQPPPRIAKPGCPKCGKRHPASWECDRRVQYKRMHQWVRFVNSEYVRERLR